MRGVANVEPMTPEMALRLGRAVAYHFRSKHKSRRGRIVIGKDTRLSGYMFETALAAGICSMGADVMLSGPLPTPGIAFITSSMRADAGVVISASHNPFEDNGIKIFAADGFKLPDEVEAEIEELMAADELDRNARRTARTIGKASKIEDARGRYVVFLQERVPAAAHARRPERRRRLRQRRRLQGRAGGVRGARRRGDRAIGVEPDGKNINDDCGALHPRRCAAAVKKHGAHLGIALDGDADRVILGDEHGEGRRRRQRDGAVRDAHDRARRAQEATRWSRP